MEKDGRTAREALVVYAGQKYIAQMWFQAQVLLLTVEFSHVR